MTKSQSSGPESCFEVLNPMKGLVRRVSAPVPDTGQDCLRLAKCSFREYLTLTEMHCLLKNEWNDAQSKAVDLCRWEACVRVADTDLEIAA